MIDPTPLICPPLAAIPFVLVAPVNSVNLTLLQHALHPLRRRANNCARKPPPQSTTLPTTTSASGALLLSSYVLFNFVLPRFRSRDMESSENAVCLLADTRFQGLPTGADCDASGFPIGTAAAAGARPSVIADRWWDVISSGNHRLPAQCPVSTTNRNSPEAHP